MVVDTSCFTLVSLLQDATVLLGTDLECGFTCSCQGVGCALKPHDIGHICLLYILPACISLCVTYPFWVRTVHIDACLEELPTKWQNTAFSPTMVPVCYLYMFGLVPAGCADFEP